MINILNQHDPAVSASIHSFALTVCRRRKLRREESEVTTVDVHQLRYKRRQKAENDTDDK